MARIAFSSEAEEILGKLAGSIFQDSYGGYQVRGFYRPKNPQTQLQQLRRGDFRYLAAGWRDLSSTDKLTWVNQAGTVPEGLRLYIGNNINLNLVGVDIISAFSAAAAPDEFPMNLIQASEESFIVEASGLLTIVPAGYKLLLYATTDKQATKLFNSPSEYSPINYFDAGTDFSSPVNLIADWNALYGVLRGNRHICIKTVLISATNGERGIENFSCIISLLIMTLQQAFDADPTAQPTINTGENPLEFFTGTSYDDGIGVDTYQDDTSFSTSASDGDNTAKLTAFVSGSNMHSEIEATAGDFDALINSIANTGLAQCQMKAHDAGSGSSSTLKVLTDQISFKASAYTFISVAEFTDNADAMANGLTDGMIYRTGDLLKIVHP